MDWGWENHDIFSSKEVAISSAKMLKSSQDIDGSINLSGVVNVDSNSSTESSRSFHKTYGNINGSSPSLEASVCSSDQSVGLILGKRTYFESDFARSSTPNIQISSVSNVKKIKSTHQSTPIARCQVEGCNLDLSSAKEYHKKHRVCENHSKSSTVVLDGVERRFCQQCSRFHGLSEFDGKKRSCRQRLSDHNARRRKPRKEAIHFNSRSPASSFYDGQQQFSFVFNNVPLVQTKPTFNSQHTAGVFHQGSNTEVLDHHRALSLLSSNSCESDFDGLDQFITANGPTMDQHAMHSTHHGLPPEYWQVDSHSQEYLYGYY